jgi:hypothetical protein
MKGWKQNRDKSTRRRSIVDVSKVGVIVDAVVVMHVTAQVQVVEEYVRS